MNLRNAAVVLLVVVAFAALTVATAVPELDNVRLVGLAAGAVVATDLLSPSPNLP